MEKSHNPKTPAFPPKSAPRLFVAEELHEGMNLQLDGGQAHYLARVMRAKPGDIIILCDNISGEYAGEITAAGKHNITLNIAKKLRGREKVPDLWLCPALLKKDRFDMVLEKAAELGTAEIHPVLMRRCVADKLNMGRAETILTEAAEQCARTALPLVHAPVKLEALLKSWPENRSLFFADETGGGSALEAFKANAGPSAILIGPEGGFDGEERDKLLAHPNVRAISLGPRILRGETAAIAALSLWMGVAGDWAGDLQN